jgi:Camelysin metallo-endopeptidase
VPIRTARRSTGTRVAASVVVALTAAALAGTGTFGTFSSTATAGPLSVQDGTVVIRVAAGDGSAAVPLSYSVDPGSSSTQLLDLVNGGNADLSSVTLATVATTSSILDTNQTDGLQMTVQSCSVRWAADQTCAGAQRTVLASGPVIRTASLSGLLSLSAGATDHLAVTMALPTSASNAFRAQTSQLSLVFSAVQRTGSSR